MPLAILVDTSPVINTVISDDGATVRDYYIDAIKNALEIMKSSGFMTPTMLGRLGGGNEICPFSSNISQLISSLHTLQSTNNETNDPYLGLTQAIKCVQDEFGTEATVQMAIIGFLGNPVSSQLSALSLPINWSCHWFLYHSIQIHSILDSYKRISPHSRAEIDFLSFTNFNLTHLMSSFIKRSIYPSKAYLSLGHIQMEVSVSPSPIATAWRNKSLKHGLPAFFPSIITISGFLPDRMAIAPPSIARFVLLPGHIEATDLTTENSSHFSPKPTFPQDPALKMFIQSLYETGRTAVVQLGENWNGLLYASLHQPLQPPVAVISEEDNKDDQTTGTKATEAESVRLILLVLDLNSTVPFVGPVGSLVLETNEEPGSIILSPMNRGEDVMDESSFIHVSPLPNSSITSELPSYLSFSEETSPLSGEADGLAIEIGKLQNLLYDLPAQRVPLFQQAERLRLLSMTFNMPKIMDMVVYEAQRECPRSKAASMTGIILSRLIDSVEDRIFPISWKGEWEQEVEIRREKKRRSRHD